MTAAPARVRLATLLAAAALLTVLGCKEEPRSAPSKGAAPPTVPEAPTMEIGGGEGSAQTVTVDRGDGAEAFRFRQRRREDDPTGGPGAESAPMAGAPHAGLPEAVKPEREKGPIGRVDVPPPPPPTLPAGERLFQAATAAELQNPYAWEVGARTIVLAIALRQDGNPWHPGVLRILANGAELLADEYNAAYTTFAGIAPQPDGRVSVVVGDQGGADDPGHVTAVLLSAAGGVVKIEETWRGDDASASPPLWVHRERAAEQDDGL